MVKNKESCSTCSANCEEYCTMMKDMDKAKFQKCDGFHQAPINTNKIIKIKIKTDEEISEDISNREQRLLDKVDLGDEWYRFIKKGGHWSFNREVRRKAS